MAIPMIDNAKVLPKGQITIPKGISFRCKHFEQWITKLTSWAKEGAS